jgi:hypothetical protein
VVCLWAKKKKNEEERMKTCERHHRAIVIWEAGAGECPLCMAEDRIEELKKQLSAMTPEASQA